MVVEGHAGQVEEVGPGGVAGDFDDERLDVLVAERRAGGGFVQLMDEVLLVLREGRVEALLGEQAGDAICDELVVAVERRDCVQAAGERGSLSSLWGSQLAGRSLVVGDVQCSAVQGIASHHVAAGGVAYARSRGRRLEGRGSRPPC